MAASRGRQRLGGGARAWEHLYGGLNELRDLLTLFLVVGQEKAAVFLETPLNWSPHSLAGGHRAGVTAGLPGGRCGSAGRAAEGRRIALATVGAAAFPHRHVSVYVNI